MRTLRSWLGLLGALAPISLPAAVGAQPVGSEFQVNTYTTSAQQTVGERLVAPDGSGGFVVVWQSNGQDGSSKGIFGQRFDSAGAAVGEEFQVNSYTSFTQRAPAIASDADGNFAVVWESFEQDGSFQGVFGQRYDGTGVPLGSEFRVNSYTFDSQIQPSIAFVADGSFVIVWASHSQDGFEAGIFGQRYDSGGVPLGGEFRVNSYTTYTQIHPSVASDASGNFVVVWESTCDPIFCAPEDGDMAEVFAQRYDSAGAPLGGEFRVNSYTTGYQQEPSVASDASGNFVVVWQSFPQDGWDMGVFGRRYDAAGVPRGAAFRVTTYTSFQQIVPSVASDASGNFVVAWESWTQDGSSEGVFGQRYDSGGVARGGEFQVNTFTTSSQQSPSIATSGSNQFVVVWESLASQDGSGLGVFGKRFDFSGAPTIHVGDLDRRAKNNDATWRAQVKTLVHDDGHSPVSGALVTLDVSGVGTRTCTTVASGVCEVSVVVGFSVPSLTFTVTSLSKAGFSYDAGANHDPDPDSNGTTIVVHQP